MTETSKDLTLDDTDYRILELLQTNGRMSNADLARQLKLSPPAIHARLRRLENQGVIREYVTLLDWEQLGYDMLCFINVAIQVHQPQTVEQFRLAVKQMPEVLECHHVTGEYDYLLKVAVRNRKELERFVLDQLTPIPGIAKIYTSLVLREIKFSTAIPVGRPPGNQ
ncbi:MAG: Lrp/AsnC family transcriptional regulator [Anaerolineae bacterium]|nr:Lrp/AsnC family transcriptional regulator [Anaerolineae bacterium]